MIWLAIGAARWARAIRAILVFVTARSSSEALAARRHELTRTRIVFAEVVCLLSSGVALLQSSGVAAACFKLDAMAFELPVLKHFAEILVKTS